MDTESLPSATHQVLGVAELLAIICEFASESTLSRLAYTSTLFSEIALDALYRRETRLEYIFQCLPHDLLHVEKSGDGWKRGVSIVRLRRAINLSDWKRFTFYSKRVQTVDMNWTNSRGIPSAILDQFCVFQGPLFPNLRNLSFRDDICTSGLYPISEFYQRARLLLSPSLRKLQMTSLNARQGNILPHLPSFCPILEDFTFTGLDHKFYPNILDDLSFLICQWKTLKRISVPSLTPRAMDHISGGVLDASTTGAGAPPELERCKITHFHMDPNKLSGERFKWLRELSISYDERSTIPSFPYITPPEHQQLRTPLDTLFPQTESTFPALRKLFIRATPMLCIGILNLTHHSPLESIEIYPNQSCSPASGMWTKLVGVITEHRKYPGLLEHLHIDDCLVSPVHNNNAHPPHILTLSHILPLLVFHNMKFATLSICDGFVFSDQDVNTIAESWKNVVKLHLQCPRNLIVSVDDGAATLTSLDILARLEYLEAVNLAFDAQASFSLSLSLSSKSKIRRIYVGRSPISSTQVCTVATSLLTYFQELHSVAYDHMAEKEYQDGWRQVNSLMEHVRLGVARPGTPCVPCYAN